MDNTENESLTLETIKKRSVLGVIALTGRTFILQAIAFAATFFLTIFLEPSEYGVFFLVSAVVAFFAYFSDVGLAAALIQKKESLSREELRTTFTIQQVLVLLVIFALVIATPRLGVWYGLGRDGIMLLYALGASLFFSSLKTIPSVLLERELDFKKLVIPQIAETLIFNLLAVYLAWKGFGITSFTYAVLARGITGLVLIYILRPWLPAFSFSGDALKALLKFGLPYQANTLLAIIKDDGLSIVLGKILGTTGFGYLAWAQKWASAPLRFFMDQVLKVTFPAFSRLQDNKAELASALSRSIFFICLLVFPSLLGLSILAPFLTDLIPRYEKWNPALFALSIYGINVLFAAVTTPLTNFFNAVGKIKITFGLMVMWTALTWALVPYLAARYGVSGAAAGFAIVGASSLVAIIIAYKFIKFDLINSVGKPLVSALVMGVAVWSLLKFTPVSVGGLVFLILAGVGVYFVSIYLLVGHSIILDIKKVAGSFKNK